MDCSRKALVWLLDCLRKWKRELFSKLSVKVLQPNFQIYTTIINALCKEGLVDEAFEAFRKMEEDGYSPDEWSYKVIIRGFLQHKDASRAVQLIGEMRDRGFFADAHTKALMVDLLSNDENLENSSNHLLFFHVFH